MRKSLKVLFVSSILALTASCQDTLDTSSHQAKEHSIKQMMVDIYPENQRIFNRALNSIYALDLKANTHISDADSIALTDKKLEGKTVEQILHLSFISKKTNSTIAIKKSKSNAGSIRAVAANNTAVKNVVLVKTQFITQ